jgi:Rieske 2Fe-2S family protein
MRYYCPFGREKHFSEVFYMSTTVRSKAPFASTLPGRYYYDSAIYAQEQEHIFGKMWVYACRADALSETGSYQVVIVAGESIIIVRNKDGILQAFLNVCRHRGARLCNQQTGQLKGAMQCHYHAWTYALEGKLIGAPNVLHELEFDRTAYGLLPVALKVWEGLIWLNLSEDLPSFDDQINDPVVHEFAGTAPVGRYNIGKLKVGKSISYDVHANWKLVLENTLECYHCGPMHPELCDLLPAFRTSWIDFDGEGTELAENIDAFTITGKASRPHLPGLLIEDLRRYYGILLMPNVFLNLLSDHVVIDTFFPLGPELTRVTCDWLFDPGVMSRADFDPMDAVEVLHLVNLQDWEVCEMAQKSMASRAFEHGGIYVPL